MSDWRPSALYRQSIYGQRRAISTEPFYLYGLKVGFSGNPHLAPITYDEFVSQVCRYRTSDVLRALAGQDRELFGPNPDPSNVQVVNAWAAAAIVKVSVLHGSEVPAKCDLSAFDLVALFHSFARVHEKEVTDSDTVLRLITQHMHQQFELLESIIEELSRTVALFHGDATEDQKLVRGAVEASLGVSIEDAVGATFIIFVVAGMTRGRWAPEILGDALMQELYDVVPADSVAKFAKHISAEKDLFAERHRRGLKKVDGNRVLTHRLWEFNPVTTHPIINDANGVAVVPMAWAVLRRITPAMLYYDGMGEDEDKFGGALGNVVEAYVGVQLRLLERTGARVIPGFKYRRGKNEVASTDWFVDLPDCLVFVEVKSTRLSLQERMGDFPKNSGAREVLTKAFKQINRDVSLYGSGRKEFLDNLPNDGKPLVGLVVTSESIHAANTPNFRALLPPKAAVGITITSLRFLERMVLMTSKDLGRELLAIQADPARSEMPMQLALPGTENLGQNPILNQVLDELPIFKWKRKWIEGPAS